MVDTRIIGQSIKKSPIQHKYNTKLKLMHPNYFYPQPNNSQFYYHNPSYVGSNSVPYYSPSNIQLINNGPSPFLPRISAASAFPHYSTGTGYSVSTNNQVKQIE